MRALRVICMLVTLLLAGSGWAHDPEPPAYRAPLLITVHDTQSPGAQCTAALAVACAKWTAETCEIWVSQSGPGAVLSALSSLMSPTQVIGHEAMHCWLHNYHGLLS